MSVSIERIAGDQDLAQALAELGEIEFVSGETEPAMYSVEGVDDLTVFAGDGSGGQFAESQSSGRIFYFTSEGGAGVVGKDFATFIAVVVAMPFWRDVLKYSGNGKLDEMRRAAEALQADWAEDEDAREWQNNLRERLAIDLDSDLVAELHAALATTGRIDDPWGGATEPLFGRFTIEDNPFWRFNR